MLGSPEYAAMVQREEEEELRRRKKMANALVDGADRWRESLRGLREAPLHQVLGVLAGGALLAHYLGQHIFLGLAILWAGVQFTVEFRPSCCRTTGAVVLLLSSLAFVLSPGAGVLATPFFEVPLCRNTSGGATALYGLRSPTTDVQAADSPMATCVSASSDPPAITVALGAADLDADRDYRCAARAASGLAARAATGPAVPAPRTAAPA